jgi:glyoxylase-like metal-dependent hydrolase (beta-lactamase superfamily II)
VILVDAGIGPAGAPAGPWAEVPGRLPKDWARGGDLLAEPDLLHVLDGDADLGHGVRATATPGHTPGYQCVLVSAPTSGC